MVPHPIGYRPAMARSRQSPDAPAVVRALLARHGTSYAEQLRINVARGTPGPLFQLLVFALLSSARISSELALRGTRGLFDAGWTSARRMAGSGWDERARVLNESGYARYDERTATMLGKTCATLLDDYGGDLRRLRGAARGEPAEERRRLKKFSGIGDVGADIFCRQAQVAWSELYPYVDERAVRAARSLKLPTDPAELARLAGGRRGLPRLVDAIVQASLAKDINEILAAAK